MKEFKTIKEILADSNYPTAIAQEIIMIEDHRNKVLNDAITLSYKFHKKQESKNIPSIPKLKRTAYNYLIDKSLLNPTSLITLFQQICNHTAKNIPSTVRDYVSDLMIRSADRLVMHYFEQDKKENEVKPKTTKSHAKNPGTKKPTDAADV